jgi:FMN phosphatase YigB (HAD superfamily)
MDQDTMEKRKTVVMFDIGGVMLRLNYHNFLVACAKASGCTEEEFRNRYIQSSIEKRALVGRDDAEGFLRDFKGIIGNGMSEPQLMELIATTWGAPIPESIRLKKKIYDAGYAVGLFSNISDIAMRILSKRYKEIFDTYDPSFPRVFSYQIGEIKPNRKMYEAVRGYENVVYIDDSLAYVAEAARMGWKGIHFTPYIDRDEVIRTFEKEPGNAGSVITAKSHKELIKALEKSGVRLDQ